MFVKAVKSKWMMGLALAAGVLLVTGSVSGGYASEGEFVDPEEETSVVAVSGEGRLEAEPDLAYLTLGVETSATDVREAQTENRTKMDAVVDTLHDMGLVEEDVRVGNYRIGQQYVRPDEDREPQYEVMNEIDVTVRDLDQVGPVLEASVDEGVNNVRSLEYGVAEESGYKLEALDRAMEHAETKGERIASFYEKSLSDVRQIRESGTSVGRMEMGVSVEEAEAIEMDAYGSAGLAAEPGEVTFEADVDVLYEIE